MRGLLRLARRSYGGDIVPRIRLPRRARERSGGSAGCELRALWIETEECIWYGAVLRKSLWF